ncbi:placenta-specific gene 8 protein-like [Pomacea canaliculata]|uniref:placenta-specific gene 8 protein-like n=1 Tax=Pomacea canaliculata TaxID=400727 RepID=UPI000D73C441|nr:placenta-specific gene 8 protein-like [Pomacea canaliculata]
MATGKWSSGLCACCKDCGSGCCACWCMPCMLCKLATRMNECFLLPCLVPCALVPMRTKLRAVGDIKGSICQDFMAVSCCYPCAVCQMSRELDQMGV